MTSPTFILATASQNLNLRNEPVQTHELIVDDLDHDLSRLECLENLSADRFFLHRIAKPSGDL